MKYYTGSGLVKSLSAAMLSIVTVTAFGQGSWSWNGNVSGNWNDVNWVTNNTGSSLPQGYLNFPSGAARTTITNNYSAGTHGFQIYFNSGASSYTIFGNSMTCFDWGNVAPVVQNDSVNLQTVSFPLVFQPAAANLYARLEPSAGNLLFTSTLTMNTNNGSAQFRVTAGNGNTVTFNGALLESGSNTSFALNGNSTVIFAVTNSYTGDTFINAGTMRFATNNPVTNTSFVRLGDTSGTVGANLNLDGGLQITVPINVRAGSSGGKIIANTATTSGTATYGGSLYLDAGATLYANSGGAVTLNNNTLDLKAQTLILDGPGTTTISGILTNSTGSGSLTKNGTGTATLTKTNYYTGATTINAGELVGQTGGACSNSSVTVANGATNGVLLAAAGGKWACSNLTYNSGTAYVDVNYAAIAPSTSVAPLLVRSNLNLNGTLNIIVRSTSLISAGQYPLISYGGALSGSVPSTAFALPYGMTASISNNTAAKSIDLVVSAQAGTFYWDSDAVATGNATSGTGLGGAGTWTSTSQNFWTSGNSVDGAFSAGGDAIFAGTAGTVSLSNDQTVNSLTFNTTGYTLTNSKVIPTGSVTFNVATNCVATIASTVIGAAGYTMAGPGTLILPNSANNTSNTLNITGGTLEIPNSHPIGAGQSGSTINISNGGTLQDDDTTAGNNFVLTGYSIALGTGGGVFSLTNSSQILILTNTVSGTSLTKSGPGEMRVLRANTFTNGLTVNGGIFTAGHSTFNGANSDFGAVPASYVSNAITIQNGSQIRLAGGANVSLNANQGITLGAGGGTIRSVPGLSFTIASIITGGGNLTLGTSVDTGTVVLSGNNTHTGNTTLAAGTVSIGGTVTTPFGFSTNVYFMGGNLLVTSDRGTTSNNLTNAVVIGANTEFQAATTTGTRDLVFGGPFSGTNGTLTIHNTETTNGGATFEVRLTNSLVFTNPINLKVDVAGNTSQLATWNTTNAGDQEYDGVISGAGNVKRSITTANTGGRTILTSSNTYSGGTGLNDGEIALGSSSSGPADAPTNGPLGTAAVTIGNGAGKLSAYLAAQTVGNTFIFSSSPLTFLGSNNLTLSGSFNFGGATRTLTVSNTGLTYLSGPITNGGGLTVSGSGVLTLGGTNTYTGTTTINSTLALTNTASIATSPIVNIVSGGTLDVTGLTGGTLLLASGQTLKGNGLLKGLLEIQNGSTVSPGASPGTITTGTETWDGGGSYVWEINNAIATEGANPGWDTISDSGALNITATSGSPFTVFVTSLTNTVAGSVTNFDTSQGYSWRLLHAASGITGFATNAVVLNTASFSNSIVNGTGSGVFALSLANSSQDLMLTFTGFPSITTQPASTLNNPGDTVNFSVVATGPSLSYQWRKGGLPISGQTNSTLSLTNIQAIDAAAYSVVISNAAGSVTSSAANLVENQTISFTQGDVTYGVSPISLNGVSSSGLAVTYTVVSGPASVSGSTLTITGAGAVSVRADQSGGGFFAAAAPVTQNFTVNPKALTITANNASKECGQTLVFTGTEFTHGALVGSDSVTGVTLTSSGTASSATSGGYPIVASAATGTGLANYSISYVDGTLTISDTQPPVILYYFTNAVVSVDTNCSALMPDVTGTNYIIATDSCSGTNITITQTPTNNAVLAMGTNVVVIAVADQAANTVYSTNTIVVSDTTAPVITLNGFSSVTVECHGSYTELGATATDNCTLSSLTTNGVVDANSPGVYHVNYVATDAAGNSATNTRTVTVSDTASPVVTLNGSSSMTVECHGSYTELGATANDACAGSLSVSVSGSVNVNTPGIYTLTYSAIDPSGNTGSTDRTVTVSDTAAPVISYNFTNLVLSVDTNCSALMPDVTGTNYIIATDACSGTNITITQTPTNNAVLALGTNVVVIAVSDVSGNTSYSTNTIVVSDTTAPVVTLNGSSTVTVECHGSYTELGATATDNCTLASLSTNGVVDANSPGNYTVSYIATDAAGNSATNTRTVVVMDTTAPSGYMLSTSVALSLGTNCTAILPNYSSRVVAADACSGTVNIVQSPAPGTVVSAGTVFVTFSVDDGNGNTNTAFGLEVVVSDTTAPVITSQPANSTNSIGSTATFSVTATSCSALGYQWFHGTNSLLNQTNSTLTVTPVGSADAGIYNVIVSSDAGLTTSADATLTVLNQVPVIISEDMLATGDFRVIFSGPAGQTYKVLGSADTTALLSTWSVLATGTFGSTNAIYLDTNAISSSQHFYDIESP